MVPLFFLLLLTYDVCSTVECPRECECDAIPPNNSSWAVYCHRGGLNDTIFADILNRLPSSLKLLDIQTSSWRPANKFKWSDNLNRFNLLKQLRLVNCAIPAMSRNIRLPSLELLDLHGNEIEHATMGNFGGMPNLRFLDLSGNHLSILPTGVFTFLRNLKSLSLANNSINELSANLLRGLRTLKSLRLDGNIIPVKQINDLFVDVPQLEELHLNGCRLSSISNLSLKDVEQLRHLGLANNNLRTIPTQELRQLAHLAVLDLSGNDLVEVGECAFCSNNISRLDLSHNRLGLVKEPFHADAFRNIPLVELDLSFNHMNEFHSSSLGWAQERLQTLSMAGNSLGEFHRDITATLPSLHSLNMAYNNIERIPLVFPPQFYHLTLLNISGNSLTYLPDNLPYLLPNLKEFDISNNKFSTLTQTAVDYIDQLERVHLGGNPWDCSCSIQHIQQHMRHRYAMRHILRYHEARCAEPALVKGQPLLSVTDVSSTIFATFKIERVKKTDP